MSDKTKGKGNQPAPSTAEEALENSKKLLTELDILVCALPRAEAEKRDALIDKINKAWAKRREACPPAEISEAILLEINALSDGLKDVKDDGKKEIESKINDAWARLVASEAEAEKTAADEDKNALVPMSDAPENNAPKKSKGKLIGIVAVIIALLAIAAVAVIFLLPKQPEEPITPGSISFTVDGTEYKNVPLEGFTMPDAPAKNGYTFSGWYMKSGDTESPFTSDSVAALGNNSATVYAKFTAISYNITYNLDGGSGDNPATYTIEDSITLANPTKPAHAFLGWYNGEQKVTSLGGATGDIALTAKWEKVGFVINYTDTKGAENSNPLDYKTDSSEITLAPLSVKYYTFLGWYNGEEPISQIPTGTSGDLTLSARWTENSLGDISFNTNKTAMKLTDTLNAALFSISCKTDKNEAANITVTANSAMSAGTEVTFTITASAAEGVTKTVTTVPIKIYGTPTISPNGSSWEGGAPSGLFTAYDSFNQPITNITTGSITESSYSLGTQLSITATATDPAGNTVTSAPHNFTCVNSNIICVLRTDGTYELTQYKGADTNVTLPSTYNGKEIVAVGSSAFKNASVISITIPATYKAIMASAFENCIALTTVSLEPGSALESVGHSAFMGCSSLSEINLPESIAEVAQYAFDGCNSALYTAVGGAKYISNQRVLISAESAGITSLTIDENCMVIADGALRNCTSLTGIVTIPAQLKHIGVAAFSGCTAEGLSFEFAARTSELTIGDMAFARVKLTSLSLPAQLTKIGKNAFFGAEIGTVTLGGDNWYCSDIGYDGGTKLLSKDSIKEMLTSTHTAYCFYQKNK